MHFTELCWAALRSGLYHTTINRYLTAEEAAYIVNDCGAKRWWRHWHAEKRQHCCR